MKKTTTRKSRPRRKLRLVAKGPETVVNNSPEVTLPENEIPCHLDIRVIKTDAGLPTVADEFVKAEECIARLRSRYVRQVTKWPANWWEAVKDRFFPDWALEEWPVVYTKHVWFDEVQPPVTSTTDSGASSHVVFTDGVYGNVLTRRDNPVINH